MQPRLAAKPHAQPDLRHFSEKGFFESAKLEQGINLSTVALAKVEANLRGLGYGG